MTALDALYAELPEVGCKGLCESHCVRDTVEFSPVETMRVERETGVRVKPLKQGVEPCAALHRGRCTVHSIRPMICRLFGAADGMRCEHGCLPTRWLTDQDMMRYLCAAMQIGQHPMYGEREVRFLVELSADPEVAPLFARYLRGDRSGDLMRQLGATIQQRRVAAGYAPTGEIRARRLG